MGREQGSEMLRRLQEQYGEMSDGELLVLAERPEDLTEMAREVLRGEMAGRKLKLETDASAGPFSGLGKDPQPKPRFGNTPAKGSVVLTMFNDAIEAGAACDVLEQQGIVVDVKDVSEKDGVGTLYGGAPVALQVIVPSGDRERAMALLREKMGLFPLREVEEADPVVDDGTVSVVGSFGRRADAEEVAQVLDEARIWHRIVTNAEGSVEDETAFNVEVREIDLVKAGEVVERAMGLG